MATALVIGGTGQIGRTVLPALLGDGWDVRVLARHAADVDGAEVVVGDRSDPEALDRALGRGVDVLVDVVAFDDRQAEPLLARADRIGSAVVVSSAAVYVDETGNGFETDDFAHFPVPVDEDQPTVPPGRETYATGKVALEQAWASSPVPTTILRPGAIHGAGCRQPREWLFVKRALDGRDVRVLAYDGESRFHTTATAVLAELVRLAAGRPGDRVLNAADPRALTVAEISTAIDAAMGVSPAYVMLPGAPAGDLGSTPWTVPHPVVLGMTRARAELGYVAPGRYEDTVRSCVDWLVDAASRSDWREAFPGFAPWTRATPSSTTPPRTRSSPAGRDGRAPPPSAMMSAMNPSDLAADNPFGVPSTLPYGLPDHSRIREEHYRPALLAGMAEQRAEIEAIATDPAAPTVENTLEALERSGRLLHRAATSFYNQSSADSTPGLEAVEEEIAPLFAAHHDAIYLDGRLFARIAALQADVDSGALELEPDTAWLLHRTHTQFVRAGVGLDEAAQDRLRALNAEIMSLETAFGRDLLAATNAAGVLITDEDELDGLAEDARAAAAKAARDRGHEQGWFLELVLPTQQPPLAVLRDRGVRERVFRASVGRGAGGPHDTRPSLLGLARKRAERAKLLGYPHHAAYVRRTPPRRPPRRSPTSWSGSRRWPSPTPGRRLPTCRGPRARPPGGHPRAVGLGVLRRAGRKERRSLDDAQLRPYFELERVLEDGVFFAANQLYGLTFNERTRPAGLPPGRARVRGVRRGRHRPRPLPRRLLRARLQARRRVDEQPRRPVDAARRRSRSWPTTSTSRSRRQGEPTLLTYDEVDHAVPRVRPRAARPVLRRDATRARPAPSVPRDFVEYPSQVNEMWALAARCSRNYAKHYQTGEPMPEELLDKVLAARQFNQGFATTEYLAAALLDQAWHQLAPDEVPTDVDDVEAFEAAALEKRRRRLRAGAAALPHDLLHHIFGGGYSAGYYAYIWSEVLDADTVEWFKENGGLTRANGDRFRARCSPAAARSTRWTRSATSAAATR